MAVVALGNPGTRYAPTRHNIAWQAIDALATRRSLSWQRDKRFNAEVARFNLGDKAIILAKPQTFMNASGFTIGEIARFHKLRPENFLVVADEVQLPLAATKVTIGGSAGGHNGLTDIIQRIGAGFIRLRLGVAPSEPTPLTLKDFVLQAFTPEEQKTLTARLPALADAIELLLRAGTDRAMNTLNQRKTRPVQRHERQLSA